MGLLVEYVRLVHNSQNVDKEPIVRFLIEISLLREMIFIQNLIDCVKKLCNKFMLVDSFTARSH